jgi:hypothetical protein
MAGKYVKMKRSFDAYRLKNEEKINQLQERIDQIL